MAPKQSCRPIDILAAAAADDQCRHVDNVDSGSGSESNKPSGSDPDSPKPIKQHYPNRKSSRKRSSPKNRLLDESNKNARVASVTRLWSEQDEIAILQGMIDFRVQKHQDPYSDMNAFLEFVQNLINVHVSKKQLVDKIRRLKNKYLANAEVGILALVMKPHDASLFELSDMIWGGDARNGIEIDENEDEEDGNVVENGVEVVKDFEEMYPYLTKGWKSDVLCSPLMKNYLMDNIHLVGGVKLRQMDNKWKNTYLEELKLYVKRLDLLKEHAQLVLDQLATSDS